MGVPFTELTKQETPGEQTLYNIFKSRLDDDFYFGIMKSYPETIEK